MAECETKTRVAVGGWPARLTRVLHPLRSLRGGSGTTSATVLSLSYSFNQGTPSAPINNGTLVKIQNNRDNNRSQNFTYDALNRLASAFTDGTNWGDTYTIDPWGNLTNKTPKPGKVTGENLQQVADCSNRLVGFSYDASGNMLSDGTSSYTYDAENRIKTAAGMGYVYDGDGERVRKCVLDGNGNCTAVGTLYWGGSSKDALDESDGGGTLTSEYVFFNGKRIARRVVATGAIFYYFADHLGSSNVITDAGGAIQGESDFYPYGGEIVIQADATANHYKFTGKERDTETGADYFGARYYSNGLGRFLTPDWSATPVPVPYAQLGNPQTLNLYSYVENNPITGTDPDGHLQLNEKGLNSDTAACICLAAAGGAWEGGPHDEIEVVAGTDPADNGGEGQSAPPDPQAQQSQQQTPQPQEQASTMAERAKIYASGFNILDLNSTMSKQSLAIGQSFHGMATGNLKEVAGAAPNTALGLTAGYKNSPDWTNKYVGYYATRVSLAVSAASATTALGIMAYQAGGLINSNRYLRIGVGRKGGEWVFRAAGAIVERFVKSGHIDFFKWPF